MKKDTLDSFFVKFSFFLQDNVKKIGVGILVAVLLLFSFFYSIKGEEEKTFLNIAKTEKAFQNFQNTIEKGEKEHKNDLYLLEQALAATPFLYPKYDGKIVELLLQENSPLDAKPALNRIKTRALKTIPLYLAFLEANFSLSVEKSTNDKALQEKELALLQKEVSFFSEKGEELQNLPLLKKYVASLQKLTASS